jgi:hypothetical protein
MSIWLLTNHQLILLLLPLSESYVILEKNEPICKFHSWWGSVIHMLFNLLIPSETKNGWKFGNFFGTSLKMIPIQSWPNFKNMAFLVHFLSFQQSSTCKAVHFTLPVSWENGNQLSLDIISNNWKWKFQTKFICITHFKMEFVKFIYNSIDKNTLKNGRKFSKIFTC